MFLKALVVIMALFFTTTGAFAEFTGPGAASGGNIMIKEILAKPVNNMWVTVKGKILRKVAPEKYIFSDGTGEIKVDIDDGYFPFNRPVTPQTIIEISGELNSDFTRLEIDVRQVIIIGDTNTAPQQGGLKSK